MEFLKRSSAGPAQPTRPIVEASNATEGPFIVLPFGQVSPHRISAAKGQDEVNEAKPCSVVSESLYYCARRRSSSALLAATPLPVGAVDDERCRRHWVPSGSGRRQAYRQRPEDHLLASEVLLPRSVRSNKVKIADDLGVAVGELEYVQAIRHDILWVVQLRRSEMNRAFFGSVL